MLKGCLKSLAILFVLIAGYYVLLHGRFMPPEDLWGAVGFGFFMWIASGLVWNALIAISHRRALKRAATNVQNFEDGEIVAVSGTIRPLGEPLLAPFSRRPCVAYEYKMGYSRGSQGTPVVTGEALAPSVIEGATGSARLLAWSFLQNFAESQLDSDEHRKNARDYVAATTFEQATLKSAFASVSGLLADDDGSIKADMNNGGAIDSDSMLLSERIIPVGAKICAIGKWSASKGGIVPDPDATNGVELIPGALDKVLEGLAKRASGFLIGAIVMSAVVNAIGWFIVTRYESQARPERVDAFIQTVVGDDSDAVAKELRSMRPFINEYDSEGRTALMLARSAAVTKLLLDAGADVNARDTTGMAPLAYATTHGDVASMKLILDRGADINAQDGSGTTALMISVENTSPEALRFLVVRKADLEARDHAGRSALDRAADYPGAREILLTAGAVDETLDTTTAPRLPEGCGEPGRVVTGYLAAIAAADVKAVNDAASSRVKVKATRASLEELKPFRPTEFRCTAGWATATLATVQIQGTSATHDFEGTVYLRLEPGGWKIKNEEFGWNERK